MLQQKGRPERPRRRDKPRSGFKTGGRFATILLIEEIRRDPEGFLQRIRDLAPLPTDASGLANLLDMEPSYVRRMFREYAEDDLANVVEIPQWGTPPTKAYTLCIENLVAAKSKRAG
jgi:hypothetical protein